MTEAPPRMTSTAAVCVAMAALSLKLLLFAAPHSTDLQVHRHWKALTYTLPRSEWYTDTSSRWTLDYPPLFAFVERMLAGVLAPIHAPLVDLSAHAYDAAPLVMLMRATVLLLDPLLAYSSVHLADALSTASILPIALVLHAPGLALVDIIHFQYNALPLAFALLALSLLSRRRLHAAAITFSVALNLKHTLLPLAAPVSIYLLSTLWRTSATRRLFLARLLALAITTISSLALPWLPFLSAGVRPILTRLFPFDRGLLHATWAPNIWAVYAASDLLLSRLFAPKSTGIQHESITRGIIGARRPFMILPNPTPGFCGLMAVLLALPSLVAVAHSPTRQRLVRGAASITLAAFLTGWHVHEKAILIPLTILAHTPGHAFVWLSMGGQLALLELVRNATVGAFVVSHFFAYQWFAFATVGAPRGAWAYLVGAVVVEGYCGVLGGHGMMFGDRLEFLPRIVVSVYSFVGVALAWMHLVGTAWRENKCDKMD